MNGNEPTTASLTRGLKIDGFRWALAGSLVISLISTLIDWGLRTMMGG